MRRLLFLACGVTRLPRLALGLRFRFQLLARLTTRRCVLFCHVSSVVVLSILRSPLTFFDVNERQHRRAGDKKYHDAQNRTAARAGGVARHFEDGGAQNRSELLEDREETKEFRGSRFRNHAGEKGSAERLRSA